jgi:predicted enzyme related to lactoylglutathione lyase
MAEPELVLQPLVHVQDMAGAVALLQALGGAVQFGSGEGDYTQLRIGGAEIGLLAHPPNPEQDEGRVELNFGCTGDLDAVETSARAAGLAVAAPVTDTGFGRQLQLRTPDGLLVKINEIDRRRLD